MRFHFSSKLTFLLLVLVIFTAFISFGTFRHDTFAHNSLTATAKVVFNGTSSDYTNQLWVTDGTAEGTSQLTNIAYYYNSLNPTNITSLGNIAIFRGQDGQGIYGLWVTDGTLSGTKELLDIPNAASSGISPTDITTFGNQALFDGFDTNGNNEVWITDGTSAGTKEITTIPDASNFETSFDNITSIGKQALFSGVDARGNAGIWVTDGTSAGTHQLSAMTQNGLVYPAGNEITAFGNKAIFNGTINGLNSDLWVTDGTTSGTQQLTNVAPFNIAPFGNSALFADEYGNLWITDGTPTGTKALTNYSFDLEPSDITAFGTKALFAGHDANDINSIWVTDGTTSGTQELTTLGTYPGTDTSDITAFGNSALFAGTDASGNDVLWTTDGTKANTQELVKNNAFQPGDIAVFGNELLFRANGPDGDYKLWKTDDTTTGTQELVDITGADPSGFYPTDMTVLSSSNNAPPTPTSSPQSLSCPSLTECILASDAAYGLDRGGSSFTPPAGMKELIRSGNIKDGFEAVALQDSTGNIIIANEGSLQFKGIPNGYTWNSGKADLAIYNDKKSIPALADAIDFAGQVVRDYYGKPGFGEIYVTGHSLGGIEAEAEAKAWGNIAGGSTFGATGLPGNTTSGGPLTLINYVEYGDPVGNYASDPVNALYDQTKGVMYHYGQVQMIGSPLDATNLRKAATNKNKALNLPPSTPASSSLNNYAPDFLSLCAYTETLINVPYHFLNQYATDLISSTIPHLTAAPLEALLLMYDLQTGNAGFNYLNATTVLSNGTLDSPDIIISENVNTGQIILDSISTVQFSGKSSSTGVATFYLNIITNRITGEMFVSSDGAVYLVALDSSETPTTISVTLKSGGSYQINYDTFNKQLWTNSINFYIGKNEKGVLTSSIYNWRAGGSQVQFFTNLPRKYTRELKNYSGPNGTGKLLSITFE